MLWTRFYCQLNFADEETGLERSAFPTAAHSYKAMSLRAPKAVLLTTALKGPDRDLPPTMPVWVL